MLCHATAGHSRIAAAQVTDQRRRYGSAGGEARPGRRLAETGPTAGRTIAAGFRPLVALSWATWVKMRADDLIDIRFVIACHGPAD